MWKVDYRCIDSIPPTPPLFNLFYFSGGGNNDQPNITKQAKRVDYLVHKSTFFPSHNARG